MLGTHAEYVLFPDDQMIVHLDIQQLTCCDNLLCKADIIGTRQRPTGRMIVY